MIRLGTRGSLLARAQSLWVRDRLTDAHPGLDVVIETIRTTGDRLSGQLADLTGDKGIFVKEVEEALLARRIDLAVHSLKDLPTDQTQGLDLAAIPAREDPRDVLVTRDGLPLDRLPMRARVGTGSPRRAAQLLAARPDLRIEPVRGNVDTRVRHVIEGAFDAVVLAAAGLSRLGALEIPPGEPGRPGVKGMVAFLPVETCVPAVGQGALAVEIRADDDQTRRLVASLDDPDSNTAVTAERSFLAALGGGCRVPVAALARVTGARLTLLGVVVSPDGGRVVRAEGSGEPAEAQPLGRRLAMEVLDHGAGLILARTDA